MRLLQVSVILFQAIILCECTMYAFSHKSERDAKVCASNTTAQDYCIIVKLWIITFTKSYVKVVWPIFFTYTDDYSLKKMRETFETNLCKKNWSWVFLRLAVKSPWNSDTDCQFTLKKKVTDESERQAKALSILKGGNNVCGENCNKI